MDDVPSEYIDLMDPSFNQLIGASDAVDLWVSETIKFLSNKLRMFKYQ